VLVHNFLLKIVEITHLIKINMWLSGSKLDGTRMSIHRTAGGARVA
jgi:hypothetical protein